MGGGLLQKVNRDTMSFATKLSHIVYADGTAADLMKLPKSDVSKFSLPGIMAVKRVNGVPTAFPAEGGHVSPNENLLQVLWDRGPVQVRLARSCFYPGAEASFCCFAGIIDSGLSAEALQDSYPPCSI